MTSSQSKARDICATQPAVRLGLVALLLLFGGFGYWSVASALSGAVVATGQIEVEQNRLNVQHPDGGVVASVLVSEGAQVAAGAVLIRLDGSALATELAIVEGTLHELQLEQARLEAERDGAAAPQVPSALALAAKDDASLALQIAAQAQLFEARSAAAAKAKEQLSLQIEQIRARLAGIAAQAKAMQVQTGLIQQELATQQDLLARGLTQLAGVLALRREEARLLGQDGELQASKAQAEEAITEIGLRISSIDLNRREEAATGLRDVSPRILELRERKLGLEQRIARLDIRAPAAGLVLGLTVTRPGAVVRGAESVLYLVPQDRPLLIAAQVSPLDIDQIYPGQPAELTFSSFASRATPHLQGRVSLVSADALVHQQSGVSFYRIEITLAKGEVARLGERALLPGMPVEAFIQTKARSPLTYLTEPFTVYFSRAFRES